MEREHRTVRCAQCPTAAVADVDGVPLCEGCLLSLILSTWDPHLMERVRSLKSRDEPRVRRAG